MVQSGKRALRAVLQDQSVTDEVGETGVKRDTGSKGTVGGKIVDVNKTVKIFSMLCKSV